MKIDSLKFYFGWLIFNFHSYCLGILRKPYRKNYWKGGTVVAFSSQGQSLKHQQNASTHHCYNYMSLDQHRESHCKAFTLFFVQLKFPRQCHRFNYTYTLVGICLRCHSSLLHNLGFSGNTYMN